MNWPLGWFSLLVAISVCLSVFVFVCLCHCETATSRGHGDFWSNHVLLILGFRKTKFFWSSALIFALKKCVFGSVQTTLLCIVEELAWGGPVSPPILPPVLASLTSLTTSLTSSLGQSPHHHHNCHHHQHHQYKKNEWHHKKKSLNKKEVFFLFWEKNRESFHIYIYFFFKAIEKN